VPNGTPVSLTSTWFLVMVVMLAVGVTVATALTWDWPRWKRTRRALSLLASQLLAMLTLAALVNAAGGFYGSLDELFGEHPAAGPTLEAGKPAAGARDPAIEPWLAKARAASGAGRGVWTPLQLAGRRTGYALPAWVYVPDAYFDLGQPTRRFPVSILLAGFPGAVENWDRQGHLVPILDRLIADGRIPPMIMVSVSQNPDARHDSECVDAVGGFMADTYLAQDAPETIAQHLRVAADRSAWSLIGYSTGGYCAVDLALRHPDRFSAAISLDGYFAPALDASTGDLFKHNAKLKRSYTPTATIHDHRAQPLRFYLMVGDAEPKAKTAGSAFAAEVRPPDSATLVDLTGGHNWNTWTTALPAALSWLASGLDLSQGTR
jgi:enterochelin esterase-like enzyme